MMKAMTIYIYIFVHKTNGRRGQARANNQTRENGQRHDHNRDTNARKCGGKQTHEMGTSMKVKQCDDHLGDGKCRAPLLFQNVKTDAAITVDIRVIHLGAERNLRHKQSLMISTEKESQLIQQGYTSEYKTFVVTFGGLKG